MKFTHFRDPLNPQNSIDHFLGYKKALKDYNLEFDDSLIYTYENVTFKEGYEFAKKVHIEHKLGINKFNITL